MRSITWRLSGLALVAALALPPLVLALGRLLIPLKDGKTELEVARDRARVLKERMVL